MCCPDSELSHPKKALFYFSGSENNSLYLYYKGLSKTLLTFKFDTVKSVLDKDRKEDDANEFVSAVCWRARPDGVSLRGFLVCCLTRSFYGHVCTREFLGVKIQVHV